MYLLYRYICCGMMIRVTNMTNKERGREERVEEEREEEEWDGGRGRRD